MLSLSLVHFWRRNDSCRSSLSSLTRRLWGYHAFKKWAQALTVQYRLTDWHVFAFFQLALLLALQRIHLPRTAAKSHVVSRFLIKHESLVRQSPSLLLVVELQIGELHQHRFGSLGRIPQNQQSSSLMGGVPNKDVQCYEYLLKFSKNMLLSIQTERPSDEVTRTPTLPKALNKFSEILGSSPRSWEVFPVKTGFTGRKRDWNPASKPGVQRFLAAFLFDVFL